MLRSLTFIHICYTSVLVEHDGLCCVWWFLRQRNSLLCLYHSSFLQSMSVGVGVCVCVLVYVGVWVFNKNVGFHHLQSYWVHCGSRLHSFQSSPFFLFEFPGNIKVFYIFLVIRLFRTDNTNRLAFTSYTCLILHFFSLVSSFIYSQINWHASIMLK